MVRSAARLLAPLAALIVLVAVFAWLTHGRFLNSESLRDILNQAALIVIVGIGVTLVIIAGGIDLSVGAVVAFSGTLAAVLMLKGELPKATGIGIGVVVCLALQAAVT